MPELPEVETVRKGLEKNIIDKTIKKVLIKRPKTIEGIKPEEFIKKLTNQTFKAVNRKAKYLFLELKSGQVLMVHLKMSGAFLIHKPQTPLPKHTHIVFELDNGYELRFKDLRAFGRMNLYENFSQIPQLNLAPEPLSQEFTLKDFELRLQKCSIPIKAVLLDQRKAVSGIGNIYADEALFASNINPNKKANLLTSQEIDKLYKAIQKIIKTSIELGGTTIRDYVSTEGNLGEYALQLFVYGQKKKDCKICGEKIQYIKLAQRGTHFCPKCQI